MQLGHSSSLTNSSGEEERKKNTKHILIICCHVLYMKCNLLRIPVRYRLKRQVQSW